MPIVNDYQEVKEIYGEVAEAGIALPVFCAEDRETLEAILASAMEFGREIGREDLPIIPAWTCRYPARSQMKLVSACGNPLVGTRLMFSDLKVFMEDDSPYRKLRVMPHLDHAFPWLDGDILINYAGMFASVMCDASEKPFEENIRLTAEYVEKVKGKVVVEGAADEIYESGGTEKNKPTTVAQAEKFLNGTGIDLLVPNVGTEHRSTGSKAVYHSEEARKISGALGKILCLHGTSSMKNDDLSKLAGDGFVKINIYTRLAVLGGQAVAGNVLSNLGNIFDEAQLKELVRKGVLGNSVLSSDYAEAKGSVKPKLACAANPPRRDAWFKSVKGTCSEFFYALGYRRFQS